jgi:hypothetical protein
MSTTGTSEEDVIDDGVAIRTLVVRDLPLLVAAVGERGRGPQLCDALHDRGLQPLERFIGTQLPRGARVGFMLDANELRLVDDRDDALLRAPRSGIDAAWLEASVRLKGTMTVLVRGETPAPDLDPAALAERLDRDARAGVAWGAIVGVAEERPTLPLVFG